MKNSFMKYPLLLVALLAGLISGCSSYVSRDIDDHGKAGELIFPDIARDATLPEGTFPNVANLRTVVSGMSKNQLYELLGRPHFREGLAGVREWDYVFNFATPTGVTVCQYKVIFDKDYLARSFHWKPGACADLLAPPKVVAGAPAPDPMSKRAFALSADAFFVFDSDVLRPEQQRALRAFATKLRETNYDRIDVVGHTDRLGSENYNQRLSLRRAEAVRGALVSEGVPASKVRVTGRGEHEPMVQCEQAERAELVACLSPNRRVDIRSLGSAN